MKTAGGAWRWVLGACVVIGVVGALRTPAVRSVLEGLATTAQDAGLPGAIAFSVVYALAAAAALPVSVLTLGAGLAWGPVAGFAVVWPGAVAGSLLAFTLARTLLRGRAEAFVARQPRLAALDADIAQRGLVLVLLLRLSPLVPFNALNYGLGVTRISTAAYGFATGLGIIPGTLLYVYLGSVGHQTTDEQTPLQRALFWTGLAVTAVVTVLVTRIAQRALSAPASSPKEDP